ncbi:MAG: heavy-metal-associated domain-containing protein, partial [Burkholderiales bacterium]|nr:heavy-metal-associated domain-containing protein [Burkholderiales bacterium]
MTALAPAARSTTSRPPTPASPAPAAPAALPTPPEGPELSELAVLDDPLERDRCTRWVVDAAGLRLGEASLQLGGLHCAACAGLIEQALGRVAGVRQVRVAAASQRATVLWDPTRTRASALVQAVRAAGYEA